MVPREPGSHRRVRVLLGGGGALVRPRPGDESVFGFTYVWLWVGLVPLSLLFGPLYRLANPLGRLARLLQLIGVPKARC